MSLQDLPKEVFFDPVKRAEALRLLKQVQEAAKPVAPPELVGRRSGFVAGTAAGPGALSGGGKYSAYRRHS